MAVQLEIPTKLTTQAKGGPANVIYLLYYDISWCSQKVQFLLCSAAVFILFILYGYMQELIFTYEGFKPFGWYLTLIQFAFYTIFSLMERLCIEGNLTRHVPMKVYFVLALLTLGTIGFSNSSLGYLNYPTQVIFKCCKLIPVLIGSILIQGKRYGVLDFGAASLMCLGLILFTLADSAVMPNFDSRGVMMISVALLCDAVIGNVQEKAMKQSAVAPSNAELILYSYSVGFVYLLVYMLVFSDMRAAFQVWSQNTVRSYLTAGLFSLSGYLGVGVVLTLVRSCGAFAAVTVTTARKAVTVLLSFLLFHKPWTWQYLWAGVLVIAGIYLQLGAKRWRNVAWITLANSWLSRWSRWSRWGRGHSSYRHHQMAQV